MIFMMSILAALGAADFGRQVDPAQSSAIGPASTYTEEVHCTGVLYVYQQRLRQSDPRQRGIRSALETFNGRLGARVTQGEVDESAVATSLQHEVNAAATAPIEAMEACVAMGS